MQVFAETKRLLLRELLPADAAGMFELDSDPEVHRYVGRNPVTTIEQSQAQIAFIRQQYIHNGIGRWAVVEKQTNSFMGWAGLKLITEPTNNHVHYHDIGYRLIRRYWGQGYATEAAAAARDYAFEQLQLPAIYGITDVQNLASRRVLEKIGLQFIETFEWQGELCNWLQMNRPAY